MISVRVGQEEESEGPGKRSRGSSPRKDRSLNRGFLPWRDAESGRALLPSEQRLADEACREQSSCTIKECERSILGAHQSVGETHHPPFSSSTPSRNLSSSSPVAGRITFFPSMS